MGLYHGTIAVQVVPAPKQDVSHHQDKRDYSSIEEGSM